MYHTVPVHVSEVCVFPPPHQELNENQSTPKREKQEWLVRQKECLQQMQLVVLPLPPQQPRLLLRLHLLHALLLPHQPLLLLPLRRGLVLVQLLGRRSHVRHNTEVGSWGGLVSRALDLVLVS